jgi:hypothetical protein
MPPFNEAFNLLLKDTKNYAFERIGIHSETHSWSKTTNI